MSRDDELKAMLEYCEAAAEGPWSRSVHRPKCQGCEQDVVLGPPGSGESPNTVVIVADVCGYESEPNATFIARSRTDLPAVVTELLEARTILRDVAITEPAMSDGMCAWCLAGLTSGDEHSETCLWWRSRAFLNGTEDRPGGEDG